METHRPATVRRKSIVIFTLCMLYVFCVSCLAYFMIFIPFFFFFPSFSMSADKFHIRRVHFYMNICLSLNALTVTKCDKKRRKKPEMTPTGQELE